MEIKILGTGSEKCKILYEEVEAAVAQTNVETNLCRIERIDDIMKFGVLATPALVINGEIKSMGIIPSRDEIITWLVSAAVTEEMLAELYQQKKERDQEKRQNSGSAG
jgi:small redox-active disulfide protein 2